MKDSSAVKIDNPKKQPSAPFAAAPNSANPDIRINVIGVPEQYGNGTILQDDEN